ncbi:MAG TPA: hypothetical protein HPP81_01685 [Deltaproteobacteria bacterium]|nr:hypothetical protein [Deltaproteobacteria bacterium]
MIKPGAIIGIGTVILVIGLSGLGLLQTGVIHPTEVKSPEPATSLQSQGTVNQTAPAAAPAPQFGVEPGTQTGPNLAESALQGRQPQSGDLAAEEPVPVPQVGKGESPYPKQDQFAHFRSSPVQIQRELSQDANATREPKCDDKRSQSHLKSESERYARRTLPAHSAQPVVIRFNFDPARDRGLNVAQVHSGDKIRVKWRRVGQVDSGVYFTFSRNINSPKGAVLKLKTRYSFDRPVMYRADRGYYVIEVKIYPGNRWNIKPRRFV